MPPAPVTVLEDEYVSLWFHAESRIVHHKMKQFMGPGVLRNLLAAGAELMEQHGATKWLSDDRNNVVAMPEDLKWADEVWYPRVVKAGFRYWAIVLPEKEVAAMQMKDVQAKRKKDGIDVETFGTVEDALAWLESR